MSTVCQWLGWAIVTSLTAAFVAWPQPVYSQAEVIDSRFWHGPERTRLVLELSAATRAAGATPRQLRAVQAQVTALALTLGGDELQSVLRRNLAPLVAWLDAGGPLACASSRESRANRASISS